MAGDIKYDIIRHIGLISEGTRGWQKELNLISQNDTAPKYDLRDWVPEHAKMGKGVMLMKEELGKLWKMIGAGLQ